MLNISKQTPEAFLTTNYVKYLKKKRRRLFEPHTEDIYEKYLKKNRRRLFEPHTEDIYENISKKAAGGCLSHTQNLFMKIYIKKQRRRLFEPFTHLLIY